MAFPDLLILLMRLSDIGVSVPQEVATEVILGAVSSVEPLMCDWSSY